MPRKNANDMRRCTSGSAGLTFNCSVLAKTGILGSMSRPVRWMTAALLIESMLFAVVALSKLVLYIDCFGFTPKRLQSTWLVCVLLFGSACALYTHLTGKKSMRVWMIFGAVTLSLLCIW